MPAADGTWHPAGKLAFGEAWSTWCEERAETTSADRDRASAYRDLEQLAPSAEHLVAGPEDVRHELPISISAVADAASDGEDNSAEDVVRAFLLRLGVWEIPPVDSVNVYREGADEQRDLFKSKPLWDEHWKSLTSAPGLPQHERAEIAEDFAFQWRLVPEHGRSGSEKSAALVRSLGRGATFYEACAKAVVTCRACNARGHKTAWDNTEAGSRWSLLRFELDRIAWVPVNLGGSSSATVRPREAWMDEEAPDVAKIAQSAYRFLPMVGETFSPALANMVGMGPSHMRHSPARSEP